ncbi:MAG: hypothetical protein LHV69_09195 [Elusimicrobia bacterium]|nr:hypothetical protein [Candidatus Obscuribacterium magneticum]
MKLGTSRRFLLCRQVAATLTAVIFSFTNILFAHTLQTSIWEERKQNLKKSETISPASMLASLPLSVGLSNLSRSRLTPVPLAPPPSSAWPLLSRMTLGKGEVKDAYRAVPSSLSHREGSIRDVILIQDVHLNTEAQSNIAGLLQTLIDTRRIRFVAVEGAFEDFNFEPFRRYPNPTITKEVADGFLAESRIGAPSYVGVTSFVEPPPFVGVDDRPHYRRNVEAYRSAMKSQKAVLREIQRARQSLEEKKKDIFGALLYAFDQRVREYESGHLNLGAFGRHLVRMCSKSGVPLLPERKAVFEPFLKAYELEASIPYERAEKERRDVLRTLAARLTEKEAGELLALSLGFQEGRLPYADYYRFLRDLLKGHGVSLEKTPQFDRYLEYVLLCDDIKVEAVLTAVRALTEDVYARLSRTGEERFLIRQSRHLYLSEKLARFELTPEEWVEYVMAKSVIPAEAGIQSGVHVPDPGFRRNDGLSRFEDFYREAEIRSRQMVDNLLHAAARVPGTDETAVLITGGFHTPDLTRLLQARGISYAVVSPKLTHVETDQGSAYLSVFSREKSPLERLFAGEKLFVYPAAQHIGVPDGGPNNLFRSASQALNQLKAEVPPVIHTDVDGTERSFVPDRRPTPWNYFRAGRPLRFAKHVLQPVVSLGRMGQGLLTSVKDLASNLNPIPLARVWSRGGLKALRADPRFSAQLLAASIILAFIHPVFCLTAVLATVQLCLNPSKRTFLESLEINFDPRFHHRAVLLLQKIKDIREKKPGVKWTAEDARELADLKVETQKAYDWTMGWIRQSSFYEDLKGTQPVILSLEAMISAVEDGIGHRLTTYDGGLGVLAGDWIKAIAYLGGVTTLKADSDAPEFTVFIPDYRGGVRSSKLDLFGRPREDLWQSFRPQDVGIGLMIDEKTGEPLDIEIPMGSVSRDNPTVHVGFRAVTVGGLRVLMPTTDVDTNESEYQRLVLNVLYQGETGSIERLRQQWLLGVAAYEFRKQLGFNPHSPIHMNETATFSYLIALMRDQTQQLMAGDHILLERAYELALELVGTQAIFFTHTLVAAGIDKFKLSVPLVDYIKTYLSTAFTDEQAAQMTQWMMDGRWSDIHAAFLPGFVYRREILPLYFIVKLLNMFGGNIVAVSRRNAQKAEDFFSELGILSDNELASNRVKWVTNGVDYHWLTSKLIRVMRLEEQEPSRREMWRILNPADEVARQIALGIPGQTMPADYDQPALRNSELREVLDQEKENAIAMIREMIKRRIIGEVRELTEKIQSGEASPEPGVSYEQRLDELKSRWMAWTGADRFPEDIGEMEKEELTQLLDPALLLEVWARRIVGYKRLLLIVFGKYLRKVEEWVGDNPMSNRLSNREQIDWFLNGLLKDDPHVFDEFIHLVRDRGFQFVFAGKTFSHERSFVQILHRVVDILSGKDPVIQNRVVFLEGYDDSKSQRLVRGADLWLNTPKRPKEASGTSGQKAILNIGVADGWLDDGAGDEINAFLAKTPPLVNPDHPSEWHGKAMDRRPEEARKTESPEDYYYRVEAENLFAAHKKAVDWYDEDRRLKEQGYPTSSRWLDLVRRSIFKVTAYDVRREFTGGVVPDYAKGVEDIRFNREEGILALYRQAVRNTRGFFERLPSILEWARIRPHIEFLSSQPEVLVRGETCVFKTRFRLGELPEEVLPHVRFGFHVGLKGQRNRRDGKDGWRDVYAAYASDSQRTEVKAVAGEPGVYEVVKKLRIARPGEYAVTSFAVGDVGDLKFPLYRKWQSHPDDNRIFSVRWNPEAEWLFDLGPLVQAGALPIWGLSDVRKIGGIEGGIKAAVYLVGTVALSLFGWFPPASAGFGGCMLSWLITVGAFFIIDFVVNVLAHTYWGVVQPDGSIIDRFNVHPPAMLRTVASATLVATVSGLPGLLVLTAAVQMGGWGGILLAVAGTALSAAGHPVLNGLILRSYLKREGMNSGDATFARKRELNYQADRLIQVLRNPRAKRQLIVQLSGDLMGRARPLGLGLGGKGIELQEYDSENYLRKALQEKAALVDAYYLTHFLPEKEKEGETPESPVAVPEGPSMPPAEAVLIALKGKTLEEAKVEVYDYFIRMRDPEKETAVGFALPPELTDQGSLLKSQMPLENIAFWDISGLKEKGAFERMFERWEADRHLSFNRIKFVFPLGVRLDQEFCRALAEFRAANPEKVYVYYAFLTLLKMFITPVPVGQLWEMQEFQRRVTDSQA